MSRIARLEDALRPFADEAAGHEGLSDVTLWLRYCRAARAALAAPACPLCDGDREIEFNDETAENFATVIACPECAS